MRAFGRWLVAGILVLIGRRRLDRPPPPRDPRRPRDQAPPLSLERPASAGAETLVAVALLLAGACGAGFAVFYLAYDDTQFMGLMAGLALAFLALALVVAGKRVVVQETAVEEWTELGDDAAREDALELLGEPGRNLSRRRLLKVAGLAAGGGLGAAAVMPLASLGPRVDDVLARTPWRDGRYVVDENDRRLRIDDIAEGSYLTAFPEGASKERFDAAVVLVRLPVALLDLPPGREDWAQEGVVGYSKTCTHAGCAVSMFRYPLSPSTTAKGPALVCPCHLSTFDVARGAEVLFGPAGRPLPQLPLTRDADGFLVAAGALTGPPGPSYSGLRLQDQADT
ncbi:MAG: ubiquinol-cytochrome c reductase iron-sulfur subunit [Solirubrobacteraceae bacterium]|jgi:ubiquinol-cytochrome c reductase iron-sulfur subunit|nr:ubiquinol-cytochrome c reductase iron-sulfur subunit [Solirubrobacteraceae bacterium]